MDENKVIFSSEFESDGLKKGVDKGVSHLHELRGEIEEVKNETKAYNKELAENNKNLEKIGTELAKVQGNQKAYNQLLEKATPIIAQLGKRNEELTKSIVNNRVETDKLSRSYREAVQHHEVLTKSMGRFGNINHLVAEQVNTVNRNMGHFVKDLAVGFAGGLVGFAIPTIAKMSEAIVELILNSEKLNTVEGAKAEIVKESTKQYAAGFATLEIYRKKLNDLTLPQEERVKIAKEYNEIADKANKIDLTQINNLDLINAKITDQIKLFKERALARAAENIITEKAEKLLTAQLEFETKFPQLTEGSQKKILDNAQKRIDDIAKKQKLGQAGVPINELIAFADLPEEDLQRIALKNKRLAVLFDDTARAIVNGAGKQIKAINEYKNGLRVGGDGASLLTSEINRLQEDFNVTLEAAAQLTTSQGLSKSDASKKDKKIPKGPANEFEKRLQALKEQLASITEKVFENTDNIRKKFQAGIDKQFSEIDRVIVESKGKKLTVGQGEILKKYIQQIADIQLNEELRLFGEKRRKALEQISDSITALQFELSTKRVAAMKDEFERERIAIDDALVKTVADLNKKERELVKQIQDNKALSQAEKDEASFVLQLLFGDLVTEAGAANTRAKADLAFKQYEKLVNDITHFFDEALTKENENTTKKIVEAAKLFAKGAISYEEFEKRKTKAVREGVHERNLLLINEAKVRIQAITDELNALTKADPTDPNIKKVKAQQQAARNALAGLERADAEGQAGDKNKDADDKIKKIVAYTQAIGSLANEIIGFWAKVNEAEQRQIERSIALQEKRVAAAQRIAERGNAEYLRQEEDRLTQLQIKQENAAKKQLAINAVLTASQALVAFVSALAKGAEIGGPLGAIASAAAVIGLLATGYSIVKSLQEQSPKLFKGSKEVKRTRGEPAGKDTINAWLNEGEAVIPTDTNKEYKPTVEAVYDKKVPAHILNTFVKSYPQTNIPVVNYNRIGESAEMKVNSDGKLVAILNEQKKEMRETREILESVDNSLRDFGVQMSMDRDGIVLAITSAISKRKISSKA